MTLVVVFEEDVLGSVRGGGEVKEIHGGGMKMCRMQFQERKKHTMCQDGTEENKRLYKSIRNKANKAVSKAERETVKALTELQSCPKWDVLNSERTES